MRLLGNILWHFPFFGFISALLTFFLGCLLVLLIIPAPIGFGLIQFSQFLLAPFSYEMISKDDLGVKQNKAWQAYSFVIMIIYLPFGIVVAVITAMQTVCLFLSIVGIPVGLVLVKSLGTYINPVGKVCVPIAVAQQVSEEKARQQVVDYLHNRNQ